MRDIRLQKSKKHLNLADRRKSVIKVHLFLSEIYSSNKLNLDSFTISKKCNLENETKIHEALLIKKRESKLIKLIFARYFLNNYTVIHQLKILLE